MDTVTGEVVQRRLGVDAGEVWHWLGELEGPVAVTYEAGPTGFGLARDLRAQGIRCLVAAPSKITRASGDRVKTDSRDALLLARLLKMGEIVEVTLPSIAAEAARDLVRAREDCRGDLMRERHRLSKLLLRNGIVYSGGQAWTRAHDAWLRRQSFDQPARQAAFESAYEAVALTTGRRDRLDVAIEAMAADSEFTQVVDRLACLRGVSTLTAFGLTVEIGDWHRFTGSSIGAFVGLTPSECSSGQSRSLGSITKTGNTHVRRLLVEAAWHHRRRYAVGATMTRRWDRVDAPVRARGHEGNQRLHARWVRFDARSKRPSVANVAIARELAGWCWSLAIMA
jgi:transposase